MEQELFFIFILIIVISMIIFNIRSSTTKSKFMGSKNNLRQLAEHLKNSNNLNDDGSLDLDSDLETESEFDSEIEDADNIEEGFDVPEEKSTLNNCCTVDCESCEFRKSKTNLCNNPNLLIDGINDSMYNKPVTELSEEKKELYNCLVPELENIDYIRYKFNENDPNKVLPDPVYLTFNHEDYIKTNKYESNQHDSFSFLDNLT